MNQSYNFEDLRDRGGLNVLRDLRMGQTVNISNVRLRPQEVFDGERPCELCFFRRHPVYTAQNQCACLAYCIAQHRSDRKSVYFQKI